jgi:hypothetical protein
MHLTFGIPVRAALKADRGEWKAFAVLGNVISVVVSCARKADHLPSRHVAVAAVDRIGKKSLNRDLEKLVEKRFAAYRR